MYSYLDRLIEVKNIKEKRRSLYPNYVLRRFPPHHCEELQSASYDSDTSDTDQPIVIPENSHVEFAVYNNSPGLQIKTRGTMNWTPVASRTRARLPEGTISVAIVLRVHARISRFGYQCHPLYTNIQELLQRKR